MILLWGLPGDGPLRAVYEVLRRRNCRPAFLNQHDLRHTSIKLTVADQASGVLSLKGENIRLEDIQAVYLRPYETLSLPCMRDLDKSHALRQHALNVEDLLLSWIELTPALVINPLEAMASNNSKPYQASLIQQFGFAVPDTLITTNPQAALAFWQRHEKVIYKSISGTRSIVSCLTEKQRARLELVRWCPTQFQQYIPGDDYRVHVVDQQLFACHIYSPAADYRYASQQGASATIKACLLPELIQERCRLLARGLGLLVAGIDLRCTPEGEWYCFEVNPSPAFTYFEQETKQPISQAISSLLVEGRESEIYPFFSSLSYGETCSHENLSTCGDEGPRSRE
ncbi:hypothetical protein KSC_072880 [Ktedonobacter sp. SOSP1-52]|uniref:ATP-grasp domain-containing protein n=1 Tax=Ktedonobacter sp. SOSP1-52 TaxID=2778366 RepID=UPI0019157598|nr:hypothetical protein [Ktedonobacter sp. SOSP1-52]GHO68396.1 hypothetical protein KSC_072880 [Ktedonobacter sp. SOSP1-52]